MHSSESSSTASRRPQAIASIRQIIARAFAFTSSLLSAEKLTVCRDSSIDLREDAQPGAPLHTCSGSEILDPVQPQYLDLGGYECTHFTTGKIHQCSPSLSKIVATLSRAAEAM